jgi:hypothetical protein
VADGHTVAAQAVCVGWAGGEAGVSGRGGGSRPPVLSP